MAEDATIHVLACDLDVNDEVIYEDGTVAYTVLAVREGDSGAIHARVKWFDGGISWRSWEDPNAEVPVKREP